MAETGKRTGLTLQQKFVKLREAIPPIEQKQYSDGVKYKFIRTFDIYRFLTPALNEWGVNFDIIAEKATRHAENGDDIYYHSYVQHTRSGDRIIWVYEADLVIRWTNADDPSDMLEVTVHALGCNDGSPDKAKGSAFTYAVKYMLFNKFSIDQGENDPDMTDYSSDAPAGDNRGTTPRNGGGGNTQQGSKNGQNGRTDGPRPLSEAQLSRMYRKGEAAGYNQGQIDKWIADRYKVQDPHNLTREQYDEACNILDNTGKQGATE